MKLNMTDLALKIISFIKEYVCDIFQKKGEKKNVVELITLNYNAAEKEKKKEMKRKQSK